MPRHIIQIHLLCNRHNILTAMLVYILYNLLLHLKTVVLKIALKILLSTVRNLLQHLPLTLQ